MSTDFYRIVAIHEQRIAALQKALGETLARELALADALMDAESRLSLLIERDAHKLLDVVARDKARQVLAQSSPSVNHPTSGAQL